MWENTALLVMPVKLGVALLTMQDPARVSAGAGTPAVSRQHHTSVRPRVEESRQ